MAQPKPKAQPAPGKAAKHGTSSNKPATAGKMTKPSPKR